MTKYVTNMWPELVDCVTVDLLNEMMMMMVMVMVMVL